MLFAIASSSWLFEGSGFWKISFAVFASPIPLATMYPNVLENGIIHPGNAPRIPTIVPKIKIHGKAVANRAVWYWGMPHNTVEALTVIKKLSYNRHQEIGAFVYEDHTVILVSPH